VRFARWFTLALFGGVSLLGQGLHLLTPCACGEPHAGAIAVGAEVCSSCGSNCRHHARKVAAARAEEPLASRSSTASQPGFRAPGHDSNCLICRFFAQGQVSRVIESPPAGHFVRPYRLAHVEVRPATTPPEPYQARGPPALV
jgi:hypothetical protein